MADSTGVSSKLNGDSAMLDLAGKIMLVAVIVVFLAVVCVFFLHIYANWFWQIPEDTTRTRRRRRRFEFAPGHQELAINTLRRGLDPSVLKSIPIAIFNPEEFKDGGLECAVCLSEVSEGEKIRFLPKCEHGFHVECIGMWFQSHSTCPLCRNQVSDPSCSEFAASESTMQTPIEASMDENLSLSNEPVNFPTNVLYWGDGTVVNSLGTCLEEGSEVADSSQPACSSSSSSSSSASDSGNRELVIDIPRNINEDEELKSPVMTRFKSLKRLLSWDNRRVSPRNTSNVDVEQGS